MNIVSHRSNFACVLIQIYMCTVLYAMTRPYGTYVYSIILRLADALIATDSRLVIRVENMVTTSS